MMTTMMTTLLGLFLSAVASFAIPMLKAKRDQYNLNIDDATIVNGVHYAEEVARERIKAINASTSGAKEKEKEIRDVKSKKRSIARSHIQETGLRTKRSNLDTLLRAKVHELFHSTKAEKK